jgi:hypothetical protein
VNALALSLALASIVHVPAELVGRAEVGDRTELRLRWTLPPEDPAFDVENIPSVRAELATRREHLAAGYAPRLTLRNLNIQSAYELFHAGFVEAGWRDRRTTLLLREQGTYGQNNFSSLTLTTNPDGSLRIEPVPTQGAVRQCSTFRFASTETAATVTVTPARRWIWTSGASFMASGGLDDCSQRTLAPLKAVGVSSNVDHAVSRRTHLLVGVDANDTAFSIIQTTTMGTNTSDANYVLVDGWLGVRYAFLPHTEGRLTAGGAVLDSKLSGRPRQVAAYPTAEASLSHTFGELDDRYALSASVRLMPLVNRLAAVVDQRLEERLVASRSVGDLTLAVAGGATQSIPTDQPSGISLFTADVTLLYHATHHLDLDVGARYLWQHTRGSAPDALVQLTDYASDSKLLYVAVVLHDDTLRFLGGSPPPRVTTAPDAVTTQPATGQPRPPRTDAPDAPVTPDFNADPHPPARP